MLRFLTAGESHGPALVVIVEGLPAGLAVTVEDIQEELRRRRLGYGRGPRMRFEIDDVRILGGVRHGRTLGSPVAVEIAIVCRWNSAWADPSLTAGSSTTWPSVGTSSMPADSAACR